MRCCALILLAVAALAFEAEAYSTTNTANAIVVAVNDAIITSQEIDQAILPQEELLLRQYPPNSPEYRRRFQQLWNEGVEALVTRRLILHEFKTAGGIIPDNYIEDKIRERIHDHYGDRVTMTKSLQARGITFETWRQQTREEIIIEIMRYQNISSDKIIISPQRIETYYAQHLDDFKLDDQVKLRMIVLGRPVDSSTSDTLKLALEILAKIEGGAPFAEMAAIHSQGSQRKEGGDWGWRQRTFVNNGASLNKGLADIAFALGPGQRSGVIALAKDGDEAYWIYQYDKDARPVLGRKYTSKDSFLEEKKFTGDPNEVLAPVDEFYLMLVEDKKTAHVKPLADVRDQIEKTLFGLERRRLENRWIERLKNKSFVRTYTD
jgi:parvulin-like peptidyl-prolyl isomerase